VTTPNDVADAAGSAMTAQKKGAESLASTSEPPAHRRAAHALLLRSNGLILIAAVGELLSSRRSNVNTAAPSDQEAGAT
jgi:hypothetical protein